METKNNNLCLKPMSYFLLAKNKTAHGYCSCRFLLKYKHIVVQMKTIRFLYSNKKKIFDFACLMI